MNAMLLPNEFDLLLRQDLASFLHRSFLQLNPNVPLAWTWHLDLLADRLTEVYEGKRVPDVLLSGNHEHIRRWRLQQALGRTWERRVDLLDSRSLSGEEKKLLEEYIRQRDDS